MYSSHVLLLAAGSAVSVAAFAPASAALRAAPVRASATCSSLKMLQEGETFPADAAQKLGVKGKNAVVYFYGADGSPSCTKEAAAFDARIADFKGLGFEVVGVRPEKEAKGEFESKYSQRFVADVDNAVRQQLDIKPDLFGLIAGRETYVIVKSGEVKMVFNDQFKPEDHVDKALEAATIAGQGNRQGSFLDGLKLPSLALPTFGAAAQAPLAAKVAPAAVKPKVVAAKTARGGLRSMKR